MNPRVIQHAHAQTPGRLLYIALQGSRLHGTHRPDSDYDWRGVYLPPLIELLDSRQKDALSFPLEGNEITLWSFPFWLRLLSGGDTNATDLYFAFTHPEGVLFETDDIKHFREQCPTKEILPRDLKGMRGFVRSQAIKYGAKGQHYQIGRVVLEAAETFDKKNDEARVRSFWSNFLGSAEGRELMRDFSKEVGLVKNTDKRDALKVLDKSFNLEAPLSILITSLTPIVAAYGQRSRAAGLQGADWKALSHSLRVLDEVIELHHTGIVSFPLKNAALLAQIKRGEVPHEDVLALLEQREKEAGQAEEKSVLAETGNRELLDEALLEVYGLTL